MKIANVDLCLLFLFRISTLVIFKEIPCVFGCLPLSVRLEVLLERQGVLFRWVPCFSFQNVAENH